MFSPNTSTKFRELYHSNHVISRLEEVNLLESIHSEAARVVSGATKLCNIDCSQTLTGTTIRTSPGTVSHWMLDRVTLWSKRFNKTYMYLVLYYLTWTLVVEGWN